MTDVDHTGPAEAIDAWLRAQMDEDEATARRAAECDKLVREGSERGLAPGDWSWLADYGQPQPGDIALIDHQMRWDPARVLREVEAKRKILETQPQLYVLRALASVYSDREGYTERFGAESPWQQGQ